MSSQHKLRCAIYTRKSTEDGLDQEFNSLDAQREACEAYITSQASLGWKVAKTQYDDGGISGGTMERPALQQLLIDIKARRINVVVVYKIDRLTRSLMDFARIVDVFDAQGVSFVSVTQQFNTTTSMGRLTLNVLLSFAQFEREVTAERIRDKIAASKKKGMWMGGPTPLGYDVKDKHLIINDAEGVTVRRLFDLYLEIKSVRKLKEEADALGIVTKHRRLRDGRLQGGKPFSRGNLYQLLSNPLYIGRVRHQEETYPGQHKRIINQETWDAVQALMSSNAVNRASEINATSPSILTALIFDETGDRLSPSHANKDGIRYRYYISHRLMQSRRRHEDGWRLPAKEIETPVVDIIHQCLSDRLWLIEMLSIKDQSPRRHQEIFKTSNQYAMQIKSGNPAEQKKLLRNFLSRVELHPDKLIIELDINKLRNILQPNVITTTHATATAWIHRIEVPHRFKKRGVEAKLIISDDASSRQDRDPHLILLIAKAHRWLNELTTGKATSIHELAEQLNEDRNEISRFLPLAFLAPDITDKILNGKQPVDLTIRKLRNLPILPTSWKEQRQLLGMSGKRFEFHHRSP